MLSRIALAASLALAAAPAAAETVIVHAGRLITDASTRPLGPSTIVVVDGRVQSISEGHTPAPAGARLVDLTGKTVLPGLIDTHVHLSGEPGEPFWRDAVDPDEWAMILGVKNARLTALAGFTTVRDVGSPQLVGFTLRRATSEGLIEGRASSPPGPPSRSSAAMATFPDSAPRSSRRCRARIHAPAPINALRASGRRRASAPTSSRSPRPAACSRSRRVASASISPTPR